MPERNRDSLRYTVFGFIFAASLFIVIAAYAKAIHCAAELTGQLNGWPAHALSFGLYLIFAGVAVTELIPINGMGWVGRFASIPLAVTTYFYFSEPIYWGILALALLLGMLTMRMLSNNEIAQGQPLKRT